MLSLSGSYIKSVFASVCVYVTDLKWGFASQALVDDGSYTPQVSFGIIILWHDDLRSL